MFALDCCSSPLSAILVLPREMLIYALFLSTAHAAATSRVYTNSTSPALTSSSALASITSSASLSSTSCVAAPGLGALLGCDVGHQQAAPAPITRHCDVNDISGYFVYCNRTGTPKYTTLLPADPYYADKINTAIPTSLADMCYTRMNNSIYDFFKTAPIKPLSLVPATTINDTTWSSTTTIQTIVTISTTIKGVATVTTTNVLSTITQTPPFTWSAYTQYAYDDTFSFTAQPPCCFNCTLFGGNVQVFYWPTSTASQTASRTAIAPRAANTTAPVYHAANSTANGTATGSTLVNSAGYTFASPSIYVAFESLRAKDLCGTVGPTFSATTLAFDPTDLSTSTGWRYDTGVYSDHPPVFYYPTPTFTQASWGAEVTCTEYTTTFYQEDPAGYNRDPTMHTDASFGVAGEIISSEGYTPSYLHLYTASYNPCSPVISVPKEVYTLYPAWQTCGAGIDAFFDPPSLLTPGTGASAFTTAAPMVPINNPATTTSAAVAASPTPTTASVTVVPVKATSETTQPKSSDPPAQSVSVASDPPAQVSSSDSPVQQPSTVVSSPLAQTQVTSNPPAQASSAVNNPSASSPAASNPAPQSATSIDPGQSSQVVSEARTSPAAITVGGSTISADPSSAFIIGSQTLTPGGQVTNAGTQYSLASNAGSLIVDGTSIQAIATSASQVVPPAAAITAGGSVITADSSSAFVIASQTLTPGGAITHSGIGYSLASNGASLVVGGTTTQAIAAPAPPSTSAYTIGSQTVVAGGAPITVAGTTYSVPAGAGSSVVVNGATQPINILPSPSTYILGSQTLAAGAPPITVAGTTYSLPSGGSSILINNTPQSLTILPSTATPTYILGSQTLAPGGSPVTLAGTIYSLPSSGSSLLINNIPRPLTALPTTPSYLIGTQTLAPGGPALTVSGTTYSLPLSSSSVLVNNTPLPLSALLSTSAAAPGYILASQTLVAGAPAITVSGTALSLLVGGASVVVGGSTTEPVGTVLGASTSTASAVGGVIVSIGGFTSATGSAVASASNTYVQVAGSGTPGNGSFVSAGSAKLKPQKGNIWGLAIGGAVMAFMAGVVF